MSGGQQVEDLTSELGTAEKKGLTIVRLIIDIAAVLISAGTGGRLTIGICVVNDDALASLVLPDATNEADKPGWLYRTRRSVFTSDPNDLAQQAHFKEDLRSKRTFRGASDNLVMVLDLGTSNASVNVDGWIRVLAMKA